MDREEWMTLAGIVLAALIVAAILFGEQAFEALAWWLLFRDRGPGL